MRFWWLAVHLYLPLEKWTNWFFQIYFEIFGNRVIVLMKYTALVNSRGQFMFLCKNLVLAILWVFTNKRILNWGCRLDPFDPAPGSASDFNIISIIYTIQKTINKFYLRHYFCYTYSENNRKLYPLNCNNNSYYQL